MRVALYARVSTLNGQHPEMQLPSCVSTPPAVDGRLLVSMSMKACRGSKDSRPALNRLMADAHRRRFDIVLVGRLTASVRSLKHLVNALADLDPMVWRSSACGTTSTSARRPGG